MIFYFLNEKSGIWFSDHIELSGDLTDSIKSKIKSLKSMSRESIAAADKCPVYILDFLSKDESEFVRSKVAYNHNCSIDIFKNLSNDESIIVKSYLCMNRNCPQKILINLYNNNRDKIDVLESIT